MTTKISSKTLDETKSQKQILREIINFDESWEIGEGISSGQDGTHISSLISVDEGWDIHYNNLLKELSEGDIKVLCAYMERGISGKYMKVATTTAELFQGMCEKNDVIGTGVLDA